MYEWGRGGIFSLYPKCPSKSFFIMGWGMMKTTSWNSIMVVVCSQLLPELTESTVCLSQGAPARF